MNTYTLKDLETIFSAKGYLPLERFVHYFTLRFGYTEREASEAYRLFSSFPKNIYGNEEMQARIDEIIPLALQIVNELQHSWNLTDKFQEYILRDKELRKLIYKQNGEIKEVELDFQNSIDILSYAALINQQIEPIALLCFCEKINNKNDNFKYLKIFEGDIFNANDSFWGNKSNIFIAQKNGTFKKLLYIKGKGYLRRGELNYDDGSFNSNCLTLTDWVKIGNVTTDLVKLTDDGIGE